MKEYIIDRKAANMVMVTDDDKMYPLSPGPSLALINHSPTGFEYGYGGSGPAQLSLAILFDFLGDGKKAIELYQDFKWDFIASAPREGFKITEFEIKHWLIRDKARRNE